VEEEISCYLHEVGDGRCMKSAGGIKDKDTRWTRNKKISGIIVK
jgi:hypothetical protein